MTSPSWQHHDEVGEALRAIIADPEYGVEALSSSQTMSNLLKDYLPGAPRERGVLVAAAEAGLAQVLADRVAQGMDVATAESLATSDLAAQAPFTPEACHWAVAELSAALGLRPPGDTGMPSAGGATTPPAGGATTPPAGGATTPPVAGATIPPAGQTGFGAGAATAPAPGSGTGPAGTGQAGTGQAGGGQGVPQGARPARRRAKAAWAVAAAVVVVVVVVVVVAVSGHPAHAAPVTPLATMLAPVTGGTDPAVIDCHQASLTGLSGVSASTYCLGATSTGDVDGIKSEAYQFSTTADYQAGLSHLNAFFGYDATGAAQGCSRTSNTTCVAQWWHDPKYPRTAGQIFEELYTVNSSGDHPTEIWTLPGQRVVFAAQDAVNDSTIPELYSWWTGLPALDCTVGCG